MYCGVRRRRLIHTYPEGLLSVSSEIPLRDSGGGDRTAMKETPPNNCETQTQQSNPSLKIFISVLLSREERDTLAGGSDGTAPGGSITG